MLIYPACSDWFLYLLLVQGLTREIGQSAGRLHDDRHITGVRLDGCNIHNTGEGLKHQSHQNEHLM